MSISDSFSFHTYTNVVCELKVKQDGVFSYYGEDGAMVQHRVAVFLSKHVEGKFTDQLNDLFRYIRANHLSDDRSCYWLDIRVSSPSNAYDVPRWHTDGRFFNRMDAKYKINTVFCGRPTMFLERTEPVIRGFEKTRRIREITDHALTPLTVESRRTIERMEHMQERMMLAEEFRDLPVISPKSGEVAVFRVGNDKLAAVHSDPRLDSDRVFLSFMVGTPSEIGELAQNRNVVFHEKAF